MRWPRHTHASQVFKDVCSIHPTINFTEKLHADRCIGICVRECLTQRWRCVCVTHRVYVCCRYDVMEVNATSHTHMGPSMRVANASHGNGYQAGALLCMRLDSQGHGAPTVKHAVDQTQTQTGNQGTVYGARGADAKTDAKPTVASLRGDLYAVVNKHGAPSEMELPATPATPFTPDYLAVSSHVAETTLQTPMSAPSAGSFLLYASNLDLGACRGRCTPFY